MRQAPCCSKRWVVAATSLHGHKHAAVANAHCACTHRQTFSTLQPDVNKRFLQVFKATAEAEAASSDADGDVHMSPAHESQAEQELAGCRQDTVSLLEAMYSQLRDSLDSSVGHKGVPGFRSFADVALAFNLPSIYEDLTTADLEVDTSDCACSCFATETKHGVAMKTVKCCACMQFCMNHDNVSR